MMSIHSLFLSEEILPVEEKLKVKLMAHSGVVAGSWNCQRRISHADCTREKQYSSILVMRMMLKTRNWISNGRKPFRF